MIYPLICLLLGAVAIHAGMAARRSARLAKVAHGRLGRILDRAAQQLGPRTGRTEFLDAAQHDLRQPLQALSLYVGALEAWPLDDRARGMLSRMDALVTTADQLAAGALCVMRLETGAQRPEPVAFRVADLLGDVAAAATAGAGIGAVRPRVVDTGLSAFGDPALLQQMLVGVTRSALERAKRRVLLGCRRRGDEVFLELHADGAALSDSHLADTFAGTASHDPARRAMRGRLDVTIFARMAGRLGHPVTAFSTQDRGGCVRLRLPRIRAPLDAPGRPLAGTRIVLGGAGGRALEALATQLEASGGMVAVVRSAEALRRMTPHGHDALVLMFDLAARDATVWLGEYDRWRLLDGAALLIARKPSRPARDVLRAAGQPVLDLSSSPARLTAALADVLAGRAADAGGV